MQGIPQASSWDYASSQPEMVGTFFLPINRLMSTKEVKVPPPNIASHFRVRSAAYNPAKGQRSGNKNTLRASPTSSRPSVLKASAITMNAMAWGMRGRQKRRTSVVRRQAASITVLARSLFSGAIVLQISGSCPAVLLLQTWRRLRTSATHQSVGVTAYLVEAGDGAGACI